MNFDWLPFTLLWSPSPVLHEVCTHPPFSILFLDHHHIC
jgi:hypothetical protein